MATTLKTTGAILVEVLGYYDNEVSKRLGSHIAKNGRFKEGRDFTLAQIPHPKWTEGEPRIITVRMYKAHTWGEIRDMITFVQSLL